MFQPVIKWSGSKRTQSANILKFFPKNFNTYYEPFLGSGSMLYASSPKYSICGDVCSPLIQLWNFIKDFPEELAESYKIRWELLHKDGYQVFYKIRERFNADNNPEDLLFLSRTCVNGLIRFNKNGEFNNSLHHTRPGISPERLKKIILDWSNHIQSCIFYCQDYSITLEEAKKGDLVYLDPPYVHTKGRYYGTIDLSAFLDQLERLNSNDVRYILSFDGKRGNSDFTVELPKELYKRHEYLPSGNSSFKKVIDKQNILVYESLYMNW